MIMGFIYKYCVFTIKIKFKVQQLNSKIYRVYHINYNDYSWC